MITGHLAVMEALQTDLPPVTLLVGPPSIGKWTIVEHLAAFYHVLAVDQFLRKQPPRIDTVREIVRFVSSAPFGAFKLVGVTLDGEDGKPGTGEPAQNALLKILEEPPVNARFILTASHPPLPTVMSRCSVFRLGLLTTSELRSILQHTGMTAAGAARAAAMGRGQVKPALDARTTDTARSTLLSLVRAVAAGDRPLFEQTFQNWDDPTHELLVVWLREAITGQRLVFSDADFFGLHRDQPKVRRMLLALSQHPQARSRIGVRAALEPFLVRT